MKSLVSPGTKFYTRVRSFLRENSPLIYTVILLALDVLLNTHVKWLVRRLFVFEVLFIGKLHVLGLCWMYVE
jgi:hypothetical protein